MPHDQDLSLREKQSLFFRLTGRIPAKVDELGMEATYGEAWRPPEMEEIYAERGIGIVGSLHGLRLALDINLFRDGEYLTATEEYRELGEWWEQQHPQCRWGGRFGDGNHFSMEHGGRK